MTSFYDALIANGYQKEDLKDMTQAELALLCQEEHIENTWSPEARAAAIAARKRLGGKNLKSSTKSVLENAAGTKTISKTSAEGKRARSRIAQEIKRVHGEQSLHHVKIGGKGRQLRLSKQKRQSLRLGTQTKAQSSRSYWGKWVSGGR